MNDFRNRVQLIGNLGMDPEIITFESGNKLAKFTLATNATYKDQKGETKKDVQWHSVVAWGYQADFAEKQLKKGNFVAIEGRLVYRSYEDKQGNKKYISEIVMNNFLMAPLNEQVAV